MTETAPSTESPAPRPPETVEDPAAILDRALKTAVKYHSDNLAEEAEQIYLAILDAVPDHADALHFLGVLRHQTGRSAEALALMRRACALIPEHADLRANIGNVLKQSGRVDEAIVEYREALRLKPDHRGVQGNLGIALLASGRDAEAVAPLRNLVSRMPDYLLGYYHLGLAIRGSGGDVDEAIACYRRSLEIERERSPAFLPSIATALAGTLHQIGRTDEAIEVYRDWEKRSPQHPVPTHMIAALSGQAPPARAGDAYVRALFDHFADSFDSLLVNQLRYRAPQLLMEALTPFLPDPPAPKLAVLDAGCGTGLCAPLLKPWSANLVGVDLSAGMIAKARERGDYDALEVAELTAWLDAHPANADLIVSADTLVYFGDLETVLFAAARALKPGGWLAFTVERETEGAAGFRMTSSGRYSHTEAYVARLLGEAGLEIRVLEHAVPRRESGRDVQGLVVVAQRITA